MSYPARAEGLINTDTGTWRLANKRTSGDHPIIISSSCAASTDITDPLSPLFPIFHRFRHVLGATSRILTELLYVGSSRSPCPCLAMLENITYEVIPASPAVSCMSGKIIGFIPFPSSLVLYISFRLSN